MREYFTLHRSVFPSYLTIESGRMSDTLVVAVAPLAPEHRQVDIQKLFLLP